MGDGGVPGLDRYERDEEAAARAAEEDEREYLYELTFSPIVGLTVDLETLNARERRRVIYENVRDYLRQMEDDPDYGLDEHYAWSLVDVEPWAPATGRLAAWADPERVRRCEERSPHGERGGTLACSCGWLR